MLAQPSLPPAGAGADSRRGAGADSRRGFGGGASFRAKGGTEPVVSVGAGSPNVGAGSLPGNMAGAGIDDERISGRLGAPGGGRLGVPTATTGTLGILAGGGMLPASAPAPSVTSTSSIVEISGFEVMLI
jgi:hypothetical protein